MTTHTGRRSPHAQFRSSCSFEHRRRRRSQCNVPDVMSTVCAPSQTQFERRCADVINLICDRSLSARALTGFISANIIKLFGTDRAADRMTPHGTSRSGCRVSGIKRRLCNVTMYAQAWRVINGLDIPHFLEFANRHGIAA